MDQKLSPILPPPSVDDLLSLSAGARLGQVDFANRLVPAPDSTPAAEAPLATVTSVDRRRAVTAIPEPEAEPEVEAVVEPEPEPESEPEPEPEIEAVVEPEPEPAAAKPAPRSRPKPAAKTTRTAASKPAAKPAARKPAASRRTSVPDASAAEPMTESTVETVIAPSVATILPIANLSGDDVSASAEALSPDHHAESPEDAVVADAAPTLRISTEPAPSPRRVARTLPVAPQRVSDDAYLGGSVQEVVDAAIERLRDAENASLQHLAALEAEATRRAELLTAQAELDAELIRITARREAHAIISAARGQAGLGAQSAREGRQLAEISDAVSRFAESIESTLAPLHPYSTQGDQA